MRIALSRESFLTLFFPCVEFVAAIAGGESVFCSAFVSVRLRSCVIRVIVSYHRSYRMLKSVIIGNLRSDNFSSREGRFGAEYSLELLNNF